MKLNEWEDQQGFSVVRLRIIWPNQLSVNLGFQNINIYHNGTLEFLEMGDCCCTVRVSRNGLFCKSSNTFQLVFLLWLYLVLNPWCMPEAFSDAKISINFHELLFLDTFWMAWIFFKWDHFHLSILWSWICFCAICIYDGLFSGANYCCFVILLADRTLLFHLRWFLSWYFELEVFHSNSSTLCNHLILLWKTSSIEGSYTVCFGRLIVEIFSFDFEWLIWFSS